MSEPLRQHLDYANPSTLADSLRALGLGGMLRALPTMLRRKLPAADASQLATVQSIGLAADGRAASILRAYALSTSAAGTLGELAVQAYGTTPADAQIAVAPNGDIVVLAASAYTSIDVQYMPEKYDLVSLIGLPVVPGTGVCALPASVTTPGVSFIVKATAQAGTSTGVKRVFVPAAGAPAAGQVRLDVAKVNAQFAVADAVSLCDLQLAVSCAIDVDAVLEAPSKQI